MTPLIRALICLALLMLPGAAFATEGGKSLRYGGGGQGIVIFDGRVHAGKGHVCNDCHLQLFTTQKKAQVRMADHFKDALCFHCHDNKTAPRDCVTCHRKVTSSGLVSSDWIRDAESKPLPESDREVYLTGKYGVTEQSRACLSCHGKQGLEPVSDRGKNLNLHVAQPAFSAGTHGTLACSFCHNGQEGEQSFTKIPHSVQRPITVVCQTCHNMRLAPEIASYDKSAHVKKLEGKFSCANCHDVHALLMESDRPGYRDSALEYNSRCLSCHAAPARFARVSGRPLYEKGMEHAFLTKWQMHSKSVLCADCHTPAMEANPHLILEKGEALRDCATCHRSMDSLIITRAGLRDGTGKAFDGSYLPAVHAASSLDILGGYALGSVLALVLLHAAARVMGRKAPHPERTVSEYVYPRFIRITHWISAICFLLLGWTGLGIRFEGHAFLPGLELASDIHSAMGIVLIVNFSVFLVLALITGDIRQYLPTGQGFFTRLAEQVRYYFYGIFTGKKNPFVVTAKRRFNPLQQVAYLVVYIIGVPLLTLSGALMLLPDSVTASLATRQCLASLHYGIAIFYAAFLVGHLYLTSTGETPLSLFKGMISGCHDHGEPSGAARAESPRKEEQRDGKRKHPL